MSNECICSYLFISEHDNVIEWTGSQLEAEDRVEICTDAGISTGASRDMRGYALPTRRASRSENTSQANSVRYSRSTQDALGAIWYITNTLSGRATKPELHIGARNYNDSHVVSNDKATNLDVYIGKAYRCPHQRSCQQICTHKHNVRDRYMNNAHLNGFGAMVETRGHSINSVAGVDLYMYIAKICPLHHQQCLDIPQYTHGSISAHFAQVARNKLNTEFVCARILLFSLLFIEDQSACREECCRRCLMTAMLMRSYSMPSGAIHEIEKTLHVVGKHTNDNDAASITHTAGNRHGDTPLPATWRTLR